MGILEARSVMRTVRVIAEGESEKKADSALPCTIDRPQIITQSRREEMMAAQDAYAQAKASLAALEAVVASEIAEKSGIQGLIERVEHARNFAESAVALAVSISLEVNAKLDAYQNDAVFKHLSRRGYDTSEYQGTGLFARLDGWLCRSISYRQAKHDFEMMQALSVAAKSREAAAQKNHEQLKAELVKSIKVVQAKHHLEAAECKLHVASDKLRQCQEKISRDQKKIDSFLNKTEAMAGRVRDIQEEHSSSCVKTRNLAASLMILIRATRLLAITSSTTASRY